ncbi:MAG: hypothetical protein ACHQ1H_09310 [Nitrososphaerales archaeon]
MHATLVEPTTFDPMVVECANYSKHGIPTGWFASREFKLDDEELYFMNHLSREDQRRIWKAHFDTGRCVPCLIDEWIDSHRFPSLEIPVASLEVLPQRKEPAAFYPGYSKLIAEKVDKIFEPDEAPPNILQRLLQLILAVERCIASCFSSKKV